MFPYRVRCVCVCVCSIPSFLCVIQWGDICMLNISTKDKAHDTSLVKCDTDLKQTVPQSVCHLRRHGRKNTQSRLLLPAHGCLFRKLSPCLSFTDVECTYCNNSFPYSVYVWYQSLGWKPNVCLLWFCKKANVRFWHVRRIVKLSRYRMGRLCESTQI